MRRVECRRLAVDAAADMGTTTELALVGTGIEASLSPALHEQEGRALGLEKPLHYRILDLNTLGLRPESVGDVIAAARLLGFDGLNITHPVKQAVIPFLDSLSSEAEAIGAVNTVVFRDGEAIGHNTDWYGFAELQKRAIQGRRFGRVVQVGAGGAGAAVAFAQLAAGLPVLDLIDVDVERAQNLADSLRQRFATARIAASPLDAMSDLLPRADGLVNATPIGMVAHPGSPVPRALLTEDLWVIDVIYRPLETQLVLNAKAVGAHATGGAGMTVFQAVEAFRLFTGRKPNADRMVQHMDRLIESGR